ncbi:hypothetical protein [Nitrosopumilus ureiphilus]|uniref:Uncharacterized protein n=1 Tax=Nitrosopumilus ureiphilus TaxID=1470067 RepID=A0A7D5R604_9ARCH|nr:hypothetical protein [Nitrosopumilus ureiphilus]QLH06278.1 hypothetical protein C5F50_03695 [Nitrosopumilus ureiphilus]
MKKRGPIISISGLVLVVISLSIASSIVPNNISEINNFSDSLLEGMFNEITDEIQIMSGDSTSFSYSTFSSDVSLMWGIGIVDYQPGDKLSINISNIFGDDYGDFIQNNPILFEMLEIPQSDTLNLEVKNIGTRNVNVVAMFSEDPDNFDPLSNSDSSTMNVVLVLAISGFLLILGIIISVIGTIVMLVDLKNNQNNKRSY